MDKPNQNTTAFLAAKIKRSLVYWYLDDLSAFMTDDPARFSRMVDGRGSQISTPESYRANIAECLAWPGLNEFFPELRTETETKLKEIDHV
jgi:hypothetical protein